MKYLYTKLNKSSVNRYEITRETKYNIWIKISDTVEAKINKKTMKTGNGWCATYYYRETADLIQRYNNTRIKNRFWQWLDKAANLSNIETMKKILSIKLDEGESK